MATAELQQPLRRPVNSGPLLRVMEGLGLSVTVPEAQRMSGTVPGRSFTHRTVSALCNSPQMSSLEFRELMWFVQKHTANK